MSEPVETSFPSGSVSQAEGMITPESKVGVLYAARWEVTVLLTFVINGESNEVTAEQFRTLVDVAVRIMKDASRTEGVDFTVESLHASAPTIVWQPQVTGTDVDVDDAFAKVARRIDAGVAMLEHDQGVPEWMAGATANALYQASSDFGEGSVDGVSFNTNGHARKLTRQTYRTLDRVLHERTDAIGSVTGTLVTATLSNGAHVTVKDEIHDRGVRCYLAKTHLREAGQLLGERVTVTGNLRRDYLGRPLEIRNSRVDATPEPRHVTVAEMAGALAGGPDSVTWLREQRGG